MNYAQSILNFDNIFDDNKDYNDFVKKFKPKKTTDDCFTPPEVFEAVKDWAVEKFSLQGKEIIRPFYPGGDFQKYNYPEDRGSFIVLDNPPFSIISAIIDFYEWRKINYFLFAPLLSLFSSGAGKGKYIVVDTVIKYQNGAVVKTGFVTNQGNKKIIISKDLSDKITQAQKQDKRKPRAELPININNAARLSKYAKFVNFEFDDNNEIEFLRNYNNIKLFGAGFKYPIEIAEELEKEYEKARAKNYGQNSLGK